jgi:hypothetical protein
VLRNQSTYSWFPRAGGQMERRTQFGKGTPQCQNNDAAKQVVLWITSILIFVKS